MKRFDWRDRTRRRLLHRRHSRIPGRLHGSTVATAVALGASTAATAATSSTSSTGGTPGVRSPDGYWPWVIPELIVLDRDEEQQ
jgi:hypothetical protein